MTRLFIYGTLLTGQSAAAHIPDLARCGLAKTARGFELYDLGAYPALGRGGTRAIEGEVVEVGADALAAIDAYEGDGFRREPISLANGERVEAYLGREATLRDAKRLVCDRWSPDPLARTHERPGWTVLDSAQVIDRPWMKLRRDRVQLASGVVLDEFHVVESRDWAAVLARTERGGVVVVEQFRHGAGRWGLELPAGVIEPGEDPADAAARELREETGYVAASLVPLSVVHTEPSRHDNRAFFFLASGAHRVTEQTLDAAEDITVREVSIAELVDAALDGRVAHGVHVGAILTAHARGLLA